MRTPRDTSGDTLIAALYKLGYIQTRQKGDHHITIPLHNPVRIGTLSQILADISFHDSVSKDELLRVLDL